MKILVVEDSRRLRESLSEGLTRSGFAVDAVGDGEHALAYAGAAQYDVIVLDLMLPVRDGLSVLSELRASGYSSQILILSAKDQVQDRVRGLDLGADDYLVKPFAFDELLARLKAMVRREYQTLNPVVKLGDVELNTALHSVRASGAEVRLTPHEISVLEALALNRGKVMSVQSLEDRLYNFRSQVTHNTIEVHISKLRKKLRQCGTRDLIKTRRGFGYFIEAE